MPAVDKSETQRDTVVLPTENSSKTVTVNDSTKSPELSESRLHSNTSSAPAGYKNVANEKTANSTITVVSPPTLIKTENLGKQRSETSTLPSTQHDTMSETSCQKTSTIVNGTKMPLRTEIPEMPAVDKNKTQRDTVVLPTANSSKTVTANDGAKSPELSDSRLHSNTSTPAGYKNTVEEKSINTTVTALSPPTLITDDNLGTQRSETTTLPSNHHDTTSTWQTVTETSSLKTSTQMPLRTGISQMPTVDKSNTPLDTVVLPTANSSKIVTMNDGIKSTKFSSNSSAPAGYKNTLEEKAANATLSVVSTSTLIKTDDLGKQRSETSTLPSTQHDTMSETSCQKTSTIVNGTKMPLRTEIPQMPAVDKSKTQRDTVVLPTVNSSKTVTANDSTKSPELSETRLNSNTSAVPAGYKNIDNENGKRKLASPTNGLRTTVFEAKSTASNATSSETERSRKTDADDVAGSSLIAATLSRLHAAAAAAADAVGSVEAHNRVDAMDEISSASVNETSLPSSSSSEHRTTTAENRDSKDRSVNMAESPVTSPSYTTSRARSRTPSTVQEMLIPSVGQKNVKSPSLVNRTNDAAWSGSGRQSKGTLPSSSSKSNLVPKSASVKSGSAVKSRSRTPVNVHEMLMPALTPSSGRTDRESTNVTSTSRSTITSTSRSRTSSTSSTTEKKSGNDTPVKPVKPSSQPVQRQASSSDTASRNAAVTTDHNSARQMTASSTLQQTPSTPACKVIQPAKERKMASQTTTATTKQTSDAVSKTSMMVGDDNWKTTLAGIIQASATTGDDTIGLAENGIQQSPSMTSLQSEPPASRIRRKSGSGLSSLMRPTASSMARRGSIGDAGLSPGSAGRAGYAAPTSSSASKSMSSGMSRTSSSPALRIGGSLSLPSRAAAAGTASGPTTPTSPRRTMNSVALQSVARLTKTANTPSTTARTPRPGTTTTTPGRTTTTTTNNNVRGGSTQTASRTTVSSRSRHNSTSSNSGDAITSRR